MPNMGDGPEYENQSFNRINLFKDWKFWKKISWRKIVSIPIKLTFDTIATYFTPHSVDVGGKRLGRQILNKYPSVCYDPLASWKKAGRSSKWKRRGRDLRRVALCLPVTFFSNTAEISSSCPVTQRLSTPERADNFFPFIL